MPQQRVEVEEDAVFLNIPYDPQFEKLYFAYIVGLTTLAFVPRATLDLTGAMRLERIVRLICSCRYSVHDLSRARKYPVPSTKLSVTKDSLTPLPGAVECRRGASPWKKDPRPTRWPAPPWPSF